MNLIQTWNNIRTHLAINYVLELQRVEKKFRRKMLIAYIKSTTSCFDQLKDKCMLCDRNIYAYAPSNSERVRFSLMMISFIVWLHRDLSTHTSSYFLLLHYSHFIFSLAFSLSLFSSFFLNLCEVINVTSFSLIFRPSTAICWLYSAIARASDEDDADDEWNKNKKKIACSVCWFSV